MIVSRTVQKALPKEPYFKGSHSESVKECNTCRRLRPIEMFTKKANGEFKACKICRKKVTDRAEHKKDEGVAQIGRINADGSYTPGHNPNTNKWLIHPRDGKK